MGENEKFVTGMLEQWGRYGQSHEDKQIWLLQQIALFNAQILDLLLKRKEV